MFSFGWWSKDKSKVNVASDKQDSMEVQSATPATPVLFSKEEALRIRIECIRSGQRGF